MNNDTKKKAGTAAVMALLGGTAACTTTPHAKPDNPAEFAAIAAPYAGPEGIQYPSAQVGSLIFKHPDTLPVQRAQQEYNAKLEADKDAAAIITAKGKDGADGLCAVNVDETSLGVARLTALAITKEPTSYNKGVGSNGDTQAGATIMNNARREDLKNMDGAYRTEMKVVKEKNCDKALKPGLQRKSGISSQNATANSRSLTSAPVGLPPINIGIVQVNNGGGSPTATATFAERITNQSPTTPNQR